MTNPTRKRVVTLDDLNVLNQNAAYARQKGEEASAAAQLADTARQNLEALGGDTQAAGEQATQAAQAATLAKHSATAAALQASQAAGDAVTAAELAEGAAGTANQAAGAATTAALALTGIRVDLAETALQAQAATTQALGVAGIGAQYVSNTTADPPAAPDGTRGARRDAYGNLVLLTRTAGAWASDNLALASVSTVTGLTPDPDAGLRPITTADLAPGTPILGQRFVLLDRPRTGGALPGLGGVPMSVWDWEFQPMPWLTERELGAGELYVRAQIFGFTNATYPLRVRLLNTTFNQSADITIADVPDDENSGAGFYRWKRSAWLPIRDVTLLGRRVTPTLQCQILAPSGVVELWFLALEFAWRR